MLEVICVSEDYRRQFQEQVDKIRDRSLKEKMMGRLQRLEETLKLYKIPSPSK